MYDGPESAYCSNKYISLQDKQELASQILHSEDSCYTIERYDSSEERIKFSAHDHKAQETNIAKIGKPIPDQISVHQELTDDQLTEEAQVDKLQHLAGTLNTADVATRGIATPADVLPDSKWLNGPAFLSQDRSTWPLSHDFIRKVP